MNKIQSLIVRLIAGLGGLGVGFATTQIWLNHRVFLMALILPQMIGILGYLVTRKSSLRVARALGTLLPPTWFFFIGLRFLFPAPPDGACGMMVLAILFLGVGGILFHALIGIVVQTAISLFKWSSSAAA